MNGKTGLIVINKNEHSDEFWDGFMSAVNFFNGADGFQLLQDGETYVLLSIPNQDNITYSLQDKKVIFESIGVEV